MKFHSTQYENLKPYWDKDINNKISIKNNLLYSKIDDIISYVITDKTLNISLNYISKLDFNYPIFKVNDEVFSSLKTKFLEIQTGSEFENIEKQDDDIIEVESDLLEFLQQSQDLLSSESSAPTIKLVNSLFFQAVKKGSSDIHIETLEKRGEVRLRIDGILQKHIDLTKNITSLVISRIKVISHLDISEKRIPQDGRTKITISGKNTDIRVSVLPTYYGERVVMRMLMQTSDIPTLETLGFDKALTENLYNILRHPYGMILVTGPTGSGKSTTLHACLEHISRTDNNIITIEDPVEYNSDNINQIQVNSKVGLTFAAGLRSILRQDPDIIMVGEIRDSETANIALRSALTGHLLLSTLHTNNSTSSLSRLSDMGIENFLISSTLLCVLAQKLGKKLCSFCKVPTKFDDNILEELKLPKDGNYHKAVGCKKCEFIGYKGRVAIGELFIIDEDVKDMMKKKYTDTEIRKEMKKKGMLFISDRLKVLLIEGLITYEESIHIGIMEI